MASSIRSQLEALGSEECIIRMGIVVTEYEGLMLPMDDTVDDGDVETIEEFAYVARDGKWREESFRDTYEQRRDAMRSAAARIRKEMSIYDKNHHPLFVGVTFAKASAQAIDFVLDPEGYEEDEEVSKLAERAYREVKSLVEQKIVDDVLGALAICGEEAISTDEPINGSVPLDEPFPEKSVPRDEPPGQIGK